MTRFLVESLLRIRNGEDLRAFKEMLQARSEKARDACTSLSGDALMRAQGRALELKELLELIEKSPDFRDKVVDR